MKLTTQCPQPFNIFTSDQRPPKHEDETLTRKFDIATLTNSSFVLPLLKKMSRNFNTLYNKRAFLHWFVQEGMSYRDFGYASRSLEAFIKNYEEAFEHLNTDNDGQNDEI